MKLGTTSRLNIKLDGKSSYITGFPKFDIGWQWALEELEEALISQRVDIRPNGGYVVNDMWATHEIMEYAAKELMVLDPLRCIKHQMYIATTAHSALLGKHNDPDQDSIILQCQGRTAVQVGDQYGVLEPGDVMYLNGNDQHKFMSMGPRISITTSLEKL